MHTNEVHVPIAVATHNLSSSLQDWWAKVKEYESLHVPQIVEFYFKIANFGMFSTPRRPRTSGIWIVQL